MVWDIVNQPWLPEPPVDFRQQCAALMEGRDTASASLRRLASTSMNTSQLENLGSTIKKATTAGITFSHLSEFKLAVLGSGTTCSFVPALSGAAARYSIYLEVIQGAYDQYVQSAIDAESDVNTSSPDAVLFALDARALNLHSFEANSESARATVDRAIQTISLMREGIANGCGSTVIYQTIPAIPLQLLGSADAVTAGTIINNVAEVNNHLRQLVQESNDVLLEVDALASTIGLDRWHDATKWNLYKIPFAQKLVPLYTDLVARTIAAVAGKARKCLVLDLDNTLWGGVVGDDGLDGLKLGAGDPVGEAHLELQAYALSLKDRGVILSVSSKNTEEIALRVFRDHPEMIIKENDISVFQVNWENKASNIELIARKLNIGLESLVFLDDNPAEREQVRQELPMVGVPELPTDPSYYSRALSYAGYFESVGVTDEDRNRAKDYQSARARESLKLESRDMSSYLESLEMKIDYQSFDDTGLSRITQLINKSNQFNLTTHRRTEAEVSRIKEDPDTFTLQVRLSDVFADNGMISVIICRSSNPSTWIIDTWLMSCRVLGRNVEQAVLNEIVRAATAEGVEQIIGQYIPTPKNGLVSNHYRELGFEPAGEADGVSSWTLNTRDYEEKNVPITVAD